MAEPTAQSVLSILPKPRLIALGRDVDIAVPPRATKEVQVKLLLDSGRLRFRELLRRLERSELKAACRAHALDDSGRARAELAARLMHARGSTETAPPVGLFHAHEATRHMPRPRDIVVCRHRQWLVESVVPPDSADDATRVRLVCLDDDNQGRVLELLWELELGARVHRPEAHGLGAITRVDPPRHFGAYLHALKWNSVTATDGRLFQAPFRAGIALKTHQLVPLQRALELPRANLFIADDVGLGKTIEAGLVLSELSLRQRVDFALIICPAGVALQWRDEMQKRFGVRFEVMSRAFVARRRKERGFGVNPWSTHARFIVSHQLVRRSEYREPLLTHLGERTRKSLLILDEAHVAAPSAASKYAVDSELTKVMRDIAPRFENRLFLSATPHNGHSNSFSALLELLDPQRFTRGVPIDGEKQLEAVMVRRLKQDLRDANVDASFPERRVIQLALSHREGHWYSTERRWDPAQRRYHEAAARDLGPAEPFELDLERELTRYTELAAPSGRGRLVFVNLQKRLLSSVEAFARTLRVHARTVQDRARNVVDLPLTAASAEDAGADEEHGPDDETLELLEEDRVARGSRALGPVQGEASKVLEGLLGATERDRLRPDAKVLALLDWIRRNQCAGVRTGGADSQWPKNAGKRAANSDLSWTARRLIIFTEYGDTKRYVSELLTAAVRDTEQAEERILELHGGMGDERREEVQRAFNTRPDQHPVRILIATDAAREGINLQAFCADLIHFDVPWNPARMEQRNGRIDRTLQPASEVFCSYFSYSARAADPVLQILVEKVDVIARELGSLGAVVVDAIGSELETRGVTANTRERLVSLTQPRAKGAVDAELESTRKLAKLKEQVEDASTVLERSRKVLELDTTLLRDALDVGFELASAGKMQPLAADAGEPALFELPELPDSWQGTLDTLRPARTREQSFWDFRSQSPQPVTFEATTRLGSETVQLHLQHPLVQRVLSRFMAQGFSTHDLSRVTVLRNKHDSLVRVITFGRLSLFGSAAARLHDELIAVSARWLEGKPLKPFADEGDRNALALLEQILRESPSLAQIPKALQERVVSAAPELFAELWKPVREEADARAARAIEQLKARGRSEADQLRVLLATQRGAIERRLRDHQNLSLEFEAAEKLERVQFEADAKHMQKRLEQIGRELESEPVQIESLYEVVLHRLSPVGCVVLWPASRL